MGIVIVPEQGNPAASKQRIRFETLRLQKDGQALVTSDYILLVIHHSMAEASTVFQTAPAPLPRAAALGPKQ